MKNPTRFYGIVIIILGFILCVLDAFVGGVLFILVGLFMAAAGQPKQAAKTTKKKSPAKRPTPVKPPVLVPGAPSEDAYAFQGSADDYFAALLRGCFPAYTAEQNVPTSALGQKIPSASAWECSCGVANTGKFCSNCGKAKPESKDWVCTCGTKNTGKFCAECGSKRPLVTVSADIAETTGETCKINFLLRQNGSAKLAIILCDKKDWDTDAVRNTMGICEKAGIPCLRFIRQFRHRGDYVVSRIQNALR